LGIPIQKIINDFSLGMTGEPREPDTRFAQLIKNFDAHSFRKKLVPFRSSESGDDAGNTSKKKNFAVALRTGTTYSLYALGVKSGTTDQAEILYKDLTTGGTKDLGDNLWNNTANNQSASDGVALKFECFVYYKKDSGIFMVKADGDVIKYDPSGSAAIIESDVALGSITNLAQGLVHSKDDILYIPYDNKIAKNDNGTWTAVALTLPSHLKITSIAEYGNQLAIACAPLSGIGGSVVYLWDRDETTTVLSESIPWGEGNLTILEEIEGFLIGVSYVGTSDVNFKQKAVFKYYAGSKPITFLELENETTFSTSSPNDIPIAKQKVNKYLYFSMKITLNGTIQHGIWKIGRTKSGTFSVVMDRTWNNDTAPAAADEIFNFILVGDYMFIAYEDGGTHAVSKTNDSNLHAVTAIYETVILNDGDSSKTKQLIGVTAMHEALPANGKITIKYKKDEETSFTEIISNSTDNDIRTSAVRDNSANNLPRYKEITFRIELTAQTAATTGDIGALTGLKYKSEIIEDDVY
jgi:hypothetical protein